MLIMLLEGFIIHSLLICKTVFYFGAKHRLEAILNLLRVQ